MEKKLRDKYIKIDFSVFEMYKKELIKSRIPLFRLNTEERLVLVPVKRLNAFLGGGEVRENNIKKLHLFIQKDFQKIIEEDEKVYYVQSERKFRLNSMLLSRVHIIDKLNKVRLLDETERNNLIKDAADSITRDMKKYGAKSVQAKQTYLDKAANVFNIIFLNLQNDNINYDNLNIINYQTMFLPSEIRLFLRYTMNYFSSKHASADIFEKSYRCIDNTIMSRLFRVYTLYLDFLFFYNRSFNESVVGKIRKAFKEDYIHYYINLLMPYNRVLKISKLEDIVERGMRLLTTKEIADYSISGLLKTVVFHNHSILNTKEAEYQKKLENTLFEYGYSEETVSTMSLSSNFYDYKTSTFYKDYENKKLENPETSVKFAFTYDLKPLKNLEALSYFPAKALEIIYLYDTLLHSDILPDKESDIPTSENVIFTMKDEYIESSLKIDPIIFDIFVDYVNGM